MYYYIRIIFKLITLSIPVIIFLIIMANLIVWVVKKIKETEGIPKSDEIMLKQLLMKTDELSKQIGKLQKSIEELKKED